MSSNTIKSNNEKIKRRSFKERVVEGFMDAGDFASRLPYFTQAVLRLIFRHPVTGTNIIPILADGRIVLAKKHDTGKWSLPGGMVEWGEEIATTVRRELLEETGLELIKVSRLVGVYSKPDRDPRIHSICIVVEAEVQGDIKIKDKHEVSEVKAFNLKDLPLIGLSYDNDDHLKDYLNKATTLA